MTNRVSVKICGEDYTILTEDPAEYTQKVGAYVGEKMQEILSGSRTGRLDAAVLAAMNIADELFKVRMQDEQLRAQVKGYLDDAGKSKAQVSELKRENFRLQQRLDKLEKAK